MSQKERILTAMKQHTLLGITQYWATLNLGVLRLSERIRELEKDGVEIEREWITTYSKLGYRSRYMRYRLAA